MPLGQSVLDSVFVWFWVCLLFLFWVGLYFAQQLLGSSKGCKPAINPDCQSPVPSCENRKKKSCLLCWLHFPSLEAISFCSSVIRGDGCCKRSCALTGISASLILTLLVLQVIAFSAFLIRGKKVHKLGKASWCPNSAHQVILRLSSPAHCVSPCHS